MILVNLWNSYFSSYNQLTIYLTDNIDTISLELVLAYLISNAFAPFIFPHIRWEPQVTQHVLYDHLYDHRQDL